MNRLRSRIQKLEGPVRGLGWGDILAGVHNLALSKLVGTIDDPFAKAVVETNVHSLLNAIDMLL